MKISGFSFARNTVKLYYPLEESIRSILPLCDEFIIAVGKGDDDDTTREVIEGINDPKIRIIDTEWSRVLTKNQVFAEQTNIALEACTGDWCFYIQCDEVVHEEDLPIIKKRCEDFLVNPDIEGLIFDYLHFWGDYDHIQNGHGWYRKEIRIIRNKSGIKSRNDAQSFRMFDGTKLQVALANARIFHYGWVRPPECMQIKQRMMDESYHGKKKVEEMHKGMPEEFDYGPLGRLDIYKGSHPAAMAKWIRRMDWKDRLRQTELPGTRRQLHKDERVKYRLISFVERLFGFDMNKKNWRKAME